MEDPPSPEGELAVLPGNPQVSTSVVVPEVLERSGSVGSSSSSSSSGLSVDDLQKEAVSSVTVNFGRRISKEHRDSFSSASPRRRSNAAQPSLKEFNDARRRQSFSMVQQKSNADIAVRRMSIQEKPQPQGAEERIAQQQQRRSLERDINMRRATGGSWGGLAAVRGNHGRQSITVASISGEPAPVSMTFFLTEIRMKAPPYCKFVHRNRWFQSSMFIALLIALFFPDVWILADRPSNDDLDVILTLVLLMFIVELAVQCIALSRTYIGSFFFYMDILGAVSLLLDLSYIGILGGQEGGSNVVIMRAARIAKLGARAGRFTKLVKLLRFLPGMGGYGKELGTAKAVNARLNQGLSIRVSCLIITMVMITPLFSLWTFPENDESMVSWSQRLEDVTLNRPDVLARELQKLDAFYASLDYYPYKITAKSGHDLPSGSLDLFPWQTQRDHPIRSDSVQTQETESLLCEFNFRAPNQLDSAMNLGMLIVVMFLMIGFSMVLQNATTKIILHPLEMLLAQVRQTAAMIFQSVDDMAKPDASLEEPEEDENAASNPDVFFGAEKALLDKVVEKISALQKQQEEVEDDSGGWTGMKAKKTAEGSPTSMQQDEKRRVSRAMRQNAANEDKGDLSGVLQAQLQMLDDSGLAFDIVDSWQLNPLEMDKARNKAAAVYFIGPQSHNIRCELKTTAFMDAVESSHNKSNPYHSWFHAVDVTHATWRFSRSCHVNEYLSDAERFALLIAAICHDVGHPGFNNAFLVETAHPQALTYNDRSPLENMSAALTFQLLASPQCNILAPLSSATVLEVRRVVIDAILHTDNAKHFAMVKEVQMFYEMNSEVLDASRDIFHDGTALDEDEEIFPTLEALEVYKEPANKKLLINLLLHTADLSNSTKPFRVCRTWAYKALEEFFQQGDKERQLGLPVQASNERGQVNRSFSQIGFIEFLVAPLLLPAIKVLPPFEPLLEQGILNVKSWQSQWISEAEPRPSDAEKKTVQDRVQKLQSRYNDACQASA